MKKKINQMAVILSFSTLVTASLVLPLAHADGPQNKRRNQPVQVEESSKDQISRMDEILLRPFERRSPSYKEIQEYQEMLNLDPMTAQSEEERQEMIQKKNLAQYFLDHLPSPTKFQLREALIAEAKGGAMIEVQGDQKMDFAEVLTEKPHPNLNEKETHAFQHLKTMVAQGAVDMDLAEKHDFLKPMFNGIPSLYDRSEVNDTVRTNPLKVIAQRVGRLKLSEVQKSELIQSLVAIAKSDQSEEAQRWTQRALVRLNAGAARSTGEQKVRFEDADTQNVKKVLGDLRDVLVRLEGDLDFLLSNEKFREVMMPEENDLQKIERERRFHLERVLRYAQGSTKYFKYLADSANPSAEPSAEESQDSIEVEAPAAR